MRRQVAAPATRPASSPLAADLVLPPTAMAQTGTTNPTSTRDACGTARIALNESIGTHQPNVPASVTYAATRSSGREALAVAEDIAKRKKSRITQTRHQ